MKRRKLIAWVVLIVVIAAGFLGAQSKPRKAVLSGPPDIHIPAGGIPRIAIPDEFVYRHLFFMLSTVEDDADDADKKADHNKATKLRKHFQNKIGLKDNEAALLKLHSKAADTDVKRQDEKAAEIIGKIHKETPGGKLKPGQTPPAIPQKLRDMQAEKDKMIMDRVSLLRQQLPPETVRKIDQFARDQYKQGANPRPPQNRPKHVYVKR